MSSLLAKYDVPGPRYTSYPTVPYWEKSPTEVQWLERIVNAVSEAKSTGRGAALYIHVPFCRSLCHYCGCNTFITRSKTIADNYLDNINREWALYRERLGRLQVDEIHIGGGTPTFLTRVQLKRLMADILPSIEMLRSAEMSIEVDPRVTDSGQLEELAALGFRRISLGVQDFDHAVQLAVNRVQSLQQVREVTERARACGYTSVNYDLIYGLPRQTEQSVEQTIAKVCALRPDRIAFYAYAHVPWLKKSMRKYQTADLPSGEVKRRLYERGRELLESAGYREIGMDHFALPQDGLCKASSEGRLHRNFMGYTERRTLPVLGIGVSSIGDTWDAYAQNEKDLSAWETKVRAGQFPIFRGHLLDEEDLALRRHILDLMTVGTTSWRMDQVPLVRAMHRQLAEMAKDGLVTLTDTSVTIEVAGRPFLRNVCMAFDARLARKAPDQELFSRTV